MQMPGGERGYSLIDILAVLAIISLVSAITVPMTGTTLAAQRFRSDAQALNNLVGLAKMRASAGFTRARVRVNLTDSTFVLERWDRATDAWLPEGPTARTNQGVQFGFGSLSDPPPGTQAAIGLSPPCQMGVEPGSTAIGNTACIVFNSRGLPIDGDGALFGGHALYLTNGSAVQATTVTATPRVRLWWTAASAPNWKEQQ
jgi:type II secretory pathway pseudopilin PulG